MRNSRFIPVVGGDRPSVMVADMNYWAENEREILNWMNDNLAHGIDHHQGVTIVFDNDLERMTFLLRWA